MPFGLLWVGPPLWAQPVADDALAQIRFEQRQGAKISLSLPFRDEEGREVTLKQYCGPHPVVLVLGYYQCPMLCTLVLNGLTESAAEMKWSIGREFDVVSVSVNPHETPALAAAKKRSYVKRYGRSGTAQGWHFLTGSEPAIRQLADEVGFRYVYDSGSKQYAHPSGLVILTPSGDISGYLFGVNYRPNDLFQALQRAGSNQVSSPIQQFILLCFRYNPITGKYSGAILNSVRLLSLATLAALVWLVMTLARRNRAASTLEPTANGLVSPREDVQKVATISSTHSVGLNHTSS